MTPITAHNESDGRGQTDVAHQRGMHGDSGIRAPDRDELGLRSEVVVVLQLARHRHERPRDGGHPAFRVCAVVGVDGDRQHHGLEALGGGDV